MLLFVNQALGLALSATLCAISIGNLDRSPASKLPVFASTAPAEIVDVVPTGEANNYTFAVTVRSPDTGCERYADWWEVITAEGELLDRRVLLHSHVDEQPFTRTGGTVAVDPKQEIIVRVHMSDRGYSPLALRGTVEAGFTAVTLPATYYPDLAERSPLPSDCAF